MKPFNKAKQFLFILLLLCFALLSNVLPQASVEKQIENAQIAFDNGAFRKSRDSAVSAVEYAKKRKLNEQIINGLIISARAQISLQKYGDAEIVLNESLNLLSQNKQDSELKAEIYIQLAGLFRAQREFEKSLDFAKKATNEVPENKHILGECYLNSGRILFSSGYDFSAIIWLEKAEKIFETEKINSAKLENYRFLHLAWSYRTDYQKAFYYVEKWVNQAEKSRFRYLYRQGLFELSSLQSSTGQKTAAFATMEKGKLVSLNEGNYYQAGLFLSSLLLNNLYDFEITKAEKYVRELEKINQNNSYDFEIKLGKAVLAAFNNDNKLSDQLFDELEKLETSSDFILPYWKIIIAQKNSDWEKVIKINRYVLELTEKENFHDGLPGIYLTFAKAYFQLNQSEKAIENLERCLTLVEEIRQIENSKISLGIIETYHDAYRLLSQLKSRNLQVSFELADYIKGRILIDKINNSPNKSRTVFSPDLRQKLEELSLKYLNNQSNAAELEKNEKSIINKIPSLNLAKQDLTALSKISDLYDQAVISYFFTIDKNLTAYVWEKNKPVKIVNLEVSEAEAETYAKTTDQKIKNLIFFKKDGKEIYDKLLKPLNVSAKHLIIVPDKCLWKIPFQALSPDGEKYLIEEKLISYAPSVSILVRQLKNPKPVRQTLRAFANSSFENKFLEYADTEAASVAKIYDSKPVLNASVADFEQTSANSDILHFSMHAQVDSEQPLESFLAFKKIGTEDGRLTVEELLNIKLKQGSLVFLASCDTNNVLNGEGLVSLAWGMMGSGATTVISAQWEANDKATEVFAGAFYRNYKQGSFAAEAMQKAALELIKNKSNNIHEPYYWADFTLNGDFR